MSDIREFLGEHNMGITTLSKLICIERESIRRYEDNPNRCTYKNRRKIELALRMIRDENWVRPVLDKNNAINIDSTFCLREVHLRKVLKFEREFRERYMEILELERLA